MIGMIVIKVKRGIQWDRDKIMVPTGSILFLYSVLKNIVVLKCPNS
jgi:hypothetical protein